MPDRAIRSRSQFWSHSLAYRAVRRGSAQVHRPGHVRRRPAPDDGTQTWKACWVNTLTSSNLVSSAQVYENYRAGSPRRSRTFSAAVQVSVATRYTTAASGITRALSGLRNGSNASTPPGAGTPVAAATRRPRRTANSASSAIATSNGRNASGWLNSRADRSAPRNRYASRTFGWPGDCGRGEDAAPDDERRRLEQQWPQAGERGDAGVPVEL